MFLIGPFGGTHTWFDDHATGRIGWRNMLARRGLPEDWIWDPYTSESTFKNSDVVI
jgi:hypothetical protein